MESFSQIEQMISSALQVNGRASWRQIANALDIPERTVARRGQRLLDENHVRISTYLDASRVLHAESFIIRLKIDPIAASAASDVLARHPDASSVSVLEGTNEIVCLFVPRNKRSISRLFTEELPGIPGVQGHEVSRVLKLFRSGYDWNAGRLPESVVQKLTREVWPQEEEDDDHITLDIDSSDEKLIALLAQDGRAPIANLAQELKVSVPTVRRRLNQFFRAGILHVRTEVRPSIFGFSVDAMIWLRPRAVPLERACASLAADPSVRFCAAITGTSHIFINLLTKDNDTLYEFICQTFTPEFGVDLIDVRAIEKPIRRGPLLIGT